MDEVLHANGNNNYKLPHMGKDTTIRRTGRDLPLLLACTAPLPPIHPPFATHAVTSVSMAVQAAPAIISPTLSPKNSTHIASRNEKDDDSLMGNCRDGHEDADEMGIDWEDLHEDFQEAMI
jgi:hypothetical protein